MHFDTTSQYYHNKVELTIDTGQLAVERLQHTDLEKVKKVPQAPIFKPEHLHQKIIN